MNKYLIALDMDGTLLRRDQTVSDFTIQTIKTLKELGHIIVIASGRPMRNIIDTYNLLGLNTPIISYNGGAVYGLNSGYKDQETYFNLDDVLQVFNDVGFDYFENYMCESRDRIYLKHNDTTFSTWFSYDALEVITGDLSKTLKERPLTMIYKTTDTNLERIREAAKKLPNELDVRFWSGGSFAELYYVDVNKFAAVKSIADFYGIDSKHIMSFGDASNDIPLMEGSEISVAMKNGVENIKDYAKFVTEEDNDNDGVALFLREFFSL